MKMRHEWVVPRTIFEKENAMTVFEVNDYVDIARRTDLTAYGKITAINGENATVFFKLPRRSENPTKGTWDTCEDCGWPGFLSVSGNTGELVCMKSGCGHGYGFEKRTEIIPLMKLINISTQYRNKEKRGLLSNMQSIYSDLKNKVAAATTKKAITQEENGAMLDIFKQAFEKCFAELRENDGGQNAKKNS